MSYGIPEVFDEVADWVVVRGTVPMVDVEKIQRLVDLKPPINLVIRWRIPEFLGDNYQTVQQGYYVCRISDTVGRDSVRIGNPLLTFTDQPASMSIMKHLGIHVGHLWDSHLRCDRSVVGLRHIVRPLLHLTVSHEASPSGTRAPVAFSPLLLYCRFAVIGATSHVGRASPAATRRNCAYGG